MLTLKEILKAAKQREQFENQDSEQVSDDRVVADENFLGPDKYQPTLESIYKTLGISNPREA